MYCRYCGKEIPQDSAFCPKCGQKVVIAYTPSSEEGPRVCPRCGDPVSKYAQICRNCGLDLLKADTTAKNRHCARCKSKNIRYETVVENVPVGCFTVLLYILLAVTLLGLLVVIPLMLHKKTRTVTYAVCQDCGYRWKIY